MTKIFTKFILFGILNRMSTSWYLEENQLRCLYEHCPILHGLYKNISETYINTAKKFLKVCLEKLKATFDSNERNHLKKITNEELEDIHKNYEGYGTIDNKTLELWNTGHYFPHHQIVRSLKEMNITAESDSFCNKTAKQSGKMGPGILFFHCVEHETCLGFVVMQESPRQVVNVLLSRFTEMPKYLIYDNGCNLSEYALNRYPQTFKNTRFFVDGFHYASHTNCAPTYDTGSHPFVMKSYNTSLAEQKNARFAHLKPTAPFMNTRTFMARLRYTINYVNKKN